MIFLLPAQLVLALSGEERERGLGVCLLVVLLGSGKESEEGKRGEDTPFLSSSPPSPGVLYELLSIPPHY